MPKYEIIKYTISVHYKTVESYLDGKYRTENINLMFNTKEEARKALQFIKEHYEMYKQYDIYKKDYSIKNKDKLSCTNFYRLSEYSKKSWFYYDYPEFGLFFNAEQIEVFWIGYHEQLITAEVKVVQEELDTEDIYYA